jgi:hypothetical protein
LIVDFAHCNYPVAMVLTYRCRIKDATRRHLQRQAWAVNQVWNYCGETIFLGRRYRIWLSRPVKGRILCGGFAKDARGTGEVGIDLGLKSLAALSTGEKIEAPRRYRKYEQALAIAQRAARKARARATHAKIANCRKHFLHELSARLVR